MIARAHPYWHLRALVERSPQIAVLSFSYYTYNPQSVVDERIAWQISASEFLNHDVVDDYVRHVPRGYELALHSDVLLNDGQRRHIVMVDMSTSSQAQLDKLRAFLGDNFYDEIAWFSSGRSFHGYGEALLTDTEWVGFMGLLLLANLPRMEATVDPRWIGHRLLAGYSALRWTRNTDYYIVEPSRIDRSKKAGKAFSQVGVLGKPFRR